MRSSRRTCAPLPPWRWLRPAHAVQSRSPPMPPASARLHHRHPPLPQPARPPPSSGRRRRARQLPQRHVDRGECDRRTACPPPADAERDAKHADRGAAAPDSR
eukprot:1274282-Prymnesium_polylepis.1